MTTSPPYVPGPLFPPDWSQLVPDAVGASLTGAIIGFVLWRVESTSAKRRERKEAEAHWKVKRARIGSQMQAKVEHLYRNNPAALYPQQFDRLYAVLDPQIAVWADDSPKNRELQLACTMLSDLPLLKRLTHELYASLKLEVAVQEWTDNDGANRAVDYALVRLMAGETKGFVKYEAGLAQQHELPDRQIFYERILVGQGVTAPLANFRAVQSRVEMNWESLREMLLTP